VRGAWLVALAACGGDALPERDVLLFTGTTGFRHEDAIEAASASLPARLADAGITSELTGDPAALEDLARFRAVVFLYTSGDPLVTPRGRTEVEAFVAAGGAWVGLHSAADTEYAWPFYQQLVVVPFQSHPAIQPGIVDVEDRAHPATAPLPEGRWTATDEWYNFAGNPRGAGVRVLLTLDESTVGGTPGADHPLAWAHERLGGRAFYSALGHSGERWSEPAFVAHVVGGVSWALGAD
jgi:hypothetical protein